jgi:hypothetical protein
MLPKKEVIEQIIKGLQKLMRVQDWDVTLILLNDKEMEKTVGDSGVDGAFLDLHHNCGNIYINTSYEHDWYYTLVHELCHLQARMLTHAFRHLMGGKSERITLIYEQYINALTKTFINLCPVPTFNKIIQSNIDIVG